MRRALVIALGVAAMAAGWAEAEPRHAKWMGEASCSAWPKDQAYDDYDKALLLNWVLGWLSRSGAEGPDLLASVDQAAISQWLDSYCASHPDDNLITAAHVLERQLALRLAMI